MLARSTSCIRSSLLQVIETIGITVRYCYLLFDFKTVGKNKYALSHICLKNWKGLRLEHELEGLGPENEPRTIILKPNVCFTRSCKAATLLTLFHILYWVYSQSTKPMKCYYRYYSE